MSGCDSLLSNEQRGLVHKPLVRLCIWQSWISQQTDAWQWYNEWLTQSVTWYFRMACFFRPGPAAELSIVTWAKGTHSYLEGTTFPLHFAHCLQHCALLSPYTELWQCHNRKKTPLGENSHREPDWIWAAAHIEHIYENTIQNMSSNIGDILNLVMKKK